MSSLTVGSGAKGLGTEEQGLVVQSASMWAASLLRWLMNLVNLTRLKNPTKHTSGCLEGCFQKGLIEASH